MCCGCPGARIISSLLVSLMATLLFVTPERGGGLSASGALPAQVLPQKYRCAGDLERGTPARQSPTLGDGENFVREETCTELTEDYF